MTCRRNDNPSPDRLYRDKRHGWIAGVCAGIADYYSIQTGWVRLACGLGALLFSPTVPILYLLAAFLLPVRPEKLYRDARDEAFWRRYRSSPRDTLAETRRRFRQLDKRLGQLERYVTSSRFDLDRQFSDLERGGR